MIEHAWILAIDTSSEQASVALANGQRTTEVSWPAGRDQTTSVLAEIDHLREIVGIEVHQLAAVAVATGPGMFNGLRVGVSIAKGFVLGLDLPLIGVPTLDVAAHPYAGLGRAVVPVVAAGRGRLVWAVFRTDGAELTRATEPRNGTVEELAAEASVETGGAIVTGELSPDQETVVHAAPGLALPPAAARHRRASALAELARRRFLVGDTDDVVALEPVYLHAATQRR